MCELGGRTCGVCPRGRTSSRGGITQLRSDGRMIAFTAPEPPPGAVALLAAVSPTPGPRGHDAAQQHRRKTRLTQHTWWRSVTARVCCAKIRRAPC